jgi:ABC-type transport system involved in cytochrome c biogenesis ATPase subunit
MLKRLHLRNFTVFEDADFEFGPGLNVIVGTNGTGKSHVLKVGYIDRATRIEAGRASAQISSLPDPLAVLLVWSAVLRNTLLKVFSSTQAGDLIRRGKGISAEVYSHNNNSVAETLEFKIEKRDNADGHGPVSFSIDTIPSAPANQDATPVFIPAKEVLTLGWILPLAERREIPVDKTYPDLLSLLSGPPLKKPEPAQIVEKLYHLIGGKVEEEGGHFYLSAPEQPRMEMNLVAEGLRKFATLYKLLANGTLTPNTTLFWDEPEANLNPALLKDMAAVLAELARAGFQIILATHSLFLLKELHILSQQKKLPVRYFGLSAENGGPTQVAMTDSLTDLPNLVALDVEMAQSDIFLNVLNQEDANS